MTEKQSAKFLAQLPEDRREKLRRVVLVSTESDHAIAEACGVGTVHVDVMRQRLILLGVLARPTLTGPPPRQKRAREAHRQVSQPRFVRGSFVTDKRWIDGAQRWVAPPVIFDPRGYSVDLIGENPARAFIRRHHYTGSYPAARLRVGLFNVSRELVGVAVFSQPMNQSVLPCWTGHDNDVATELGRFVLLPSIAFNGESWFLARAFPIAREEKGFEAVLSYADPVAQHDATGRIVKPEHWGQIYQATNALYAGRSSAEPRIMTPTGKTISRRALSKLRNGEIGWRYALDQLLHAGAPAMRESESVREWVDRSVAGFRHVKHPGNLAYVFGLSRRAKARIHRLHDGGQKYERAA